MLEDGTNTLANKMIEKVPHPCKYSSYGCNVKKPLKEIIEHEGQCPERTIKCPHLKCKEDVIQIKKYEDHAMSTKCNRPHSVVTKRKRETHCNLQINSGQSYPLSDGSWKLKPYEDHGKIFYVHHYYIASERTFAFYVTMAENSNEAEKYLAKITLKNQNDERKYLTFVLDVMSMDSAPSNNYEVLEAESVMLVPHKTMSKFFWWENKEEGKQAAFINTTIDILV